jgi:hypothetical protein
VPTIRFRIGDAFPASDPVARCITVLAMMSNDWLRSNAEMHALDDDAPDAAGRRVTLFRQQASLHHEAAAFIANARKWFPEVDAFIQGLPQEAQDECALVVGGIDPASPHYHGDWLADNRHVTFHYAKMHPDAAAHGKEKLADALTRAADIEGSISMEDDFGSVRFGFADDVAVQWLPDAEEQAQFLTALAQSMMALARFAQRAAGAYMRARPEGTFILEP